ncbi:MAG: right-handed parallel beta-helix repeat-containing protein [Deltaproteobacteria bacterium]|nr:right-handed parallel beta-helix repeat-containing protein [Deltaproteobacteria bacterium]
MTPRRSSFVLSIGLASLAVACGPAAITTPDAGPSRTDAATPLLSDAGSSDAGSSLGGDAWAPSDHDAASPQEDDASVALADAGPSDAGPSSPDAGPVIVDTGWTDLPLGPEARVIYVSSVGGDDGDGHGFSESDPVRTLARGYALVRTGRGDHLLLRRGESWREPFPNWTKSGLSERYPSVIGAYGDGARPRILSTSRSAWTATGDAALDHVAIVGLHFDASGRSRDDNPSGIMRSAAGVGFLVEDCLFEQYRVNVSINNRSDEPMADPPIEDVRIRRSVLVDAYARAELRDDGTHKTCTVAERDRCGSAECGITDSECTHLNCELAEGQIVGECIPHSQGFYAGHVAGLVVEENVFDGNGWRDGEVAWRATNYNHGMYVQDDSSDVRVSGNVFANASSHGAQVRPGGVVEDNLFAGNAIGLSFGYVLGYHAASEAGVMGVVQRNVIRRGDDIRDASDFYRGIGMQLGNVESVEVRENVISHYASRREWGIAFQIDGQNGAGIRSLTLSHNVVYDWCAPLVYQGEDAPLGLITVRNSVLEGRDSPMGSVDTAVMRFSRLDAARWSFSDLAVWSALPEDRWLGGAVGARVARGRSTFVDPSRDLASFQASIPSPRGANWLAGARSQSRASWRTEYSARALVDYLREGFARR